MLYTEASVNLAHDEELMKLMTEAGFDAVFLGLETPEDQCLAECGKQQNRSMDLVEAVKTIQRNGMEVMGGFIIGFDNDPPNIFERQIEFIQKSGVVRAMIGLLEALPGTRLYRRLKEEGRLLEDCSGDNCDGAMNFITKMDPQLVRESYNAVLNCLYSPKEYYARVLEFLRTYEPVKRRRITLMGTTAFLNSILYMGILDKWSNRIYYWKLLLKTLVFYPGVFARGCDVDDFRLPLSKAVRRARRRGRKGDCQMVTELNRRLPVGAEVQASGGAHFRVWAPLCQEMQVVIEGGASRSTDFRGDFDLVREANGYFSGLVPAAENRTLYRYRIGAYCLVGGNEEGIRIVEPILTKPAVPNGLVHTEAPGTGHDWGLLLSLLSKLVMAEKEPDANLD